MAEPLDEVLERVRTRLIKEHNVAIRQDDPVLIAMSANLIMVNEVADRFREAIAHHRSELYELGARLGQEWSKDADATAKAIAAKVQDISIELARESIEELCSGAAKQTEQALARHERVLTKVTWCSSLAVLVAVLAASVAVIRCRG